MIKKMLNFINENPIYETLYGFDYYWPASLNVLFTTKLLIWNILQEIKKKGLHSTFTVDNPKADFERDRATLPTEYLQKN